MTTHDPWFHITQQKEYKPGDMPPEGRLAWDEWASVQDNAGLRQKECLRCGKWQYPQELSGKMELHELETQRGKIQLLMPVCNECIDK